MNWKETIDVEEDFLKYDDTNFDEIKDSILNKLRSSNEFKENPEFQDLCIELEVSEDDDEFNLAWSEIYDYCDSNKIWIKTVI